MTTTPTFWSNEFLVNTTTTGAQCVPQVTGLANGGFVVVWEDSSQTGGDTSFDAIRGQVYDALGNAVGGEILINTSTTSFQELPAVTALDGGGFVVVWQDFSTTEADTEAGAVRTRRFNDDGQ